MYVIRLSGAVYFCVLSAVYLFPKKYPIFGPAIEWVRNK
jgi:hypothetical protein